uniref:ARAD1B21010p n=1 Tax=Blastobotrys adeninivorans TaxID=409370 RepID=A0A060T6Q6_BLAAD
MSDESLAQQLMAKHASAEPQDTETISQASPQPEGQGSEPVATVKKSTPSSVDLRSMEAFPSLGGAGPSSSSSSTAKTGSGAWGGAAVRASSANGTPNLSPSPAPDAGNMAVRSGSISETITLDKASQSANAKQVLGETLAKVRKAGDVAVDSSTSRVTGMMTFIVRGRPEAVQLAKRTLFKALTVRVVKKLPVPASARAAIIGPKGSTLRPITESTGTQIKVSRDDVKGANSEDVNDNDDDEDPTVDVIIEGDREGVEQAVSQIQAIVAERVKDLTTKIKTVDPKMYPFIIGPHESNIKQLAEGKDIKITVPTPAAGGGPIILSGDRTAVLETRATIEQFVSEISSSYATSTVRIPRVKHKFLSPGAVFDATGVTVTFADGDDNAQLFGPPNKLKSARDALEQQAASLSVLSLDISRAHGKSVPHAGHLVLYFNKTGKLNSVEKTHGVRISCLSDSEVYSTLNSRSDVNVEIVGDDVEKIKEAKKAIVGLVNSLPPSHVLAVDDLDPFFYPHLRKLVKQQSGSVTTIVPPSNESDLVVMVYDSQEDDDEDFAPGDDEIRSKLDAVNHQFDDIRAKGKDIISKVLTVPANDHKYIQGPKGTTLNALVRGHNTSDSEPLVTVRLGANHKNAPGYSDSLNLTADSVWIRGIKPEVERVSSEVNVVIAEGKEYEVASNYETEFQFPTEHISKLIGKQGANLTKIREEFGVKIDIDEHGHGVVRGIKKNADEAKARIIAQGKQLADEVVLRLDIPNEHHATLIGSGGKFVKRLEDKYEVRIRFPRGEGASSGAGGDGRDAPQHKDQVVIRGPKRGAEKSKEELMDLLKYEVEHSYTETVKVPTKALARIIGRQGEFINEIKDNTDTRIDFNREDEKTSGEVSIVIVGTKTGVKSAADTIKSTAQEVIDTVTEKVDVDPKYHKWLIGPGGSVMRSIVMKATGASSEEEVNPRTIDIPPAGKKDPTIKVTGHKKVVAKIVKAINDIVKEKEQETEGVVTVPVDQHGTLIGPGGLTKRELETEFNVSLSIPRMGSGNENVVISGQPEAVEKAKARIEEMTASAYKTEIDVPKWMNNVLSSTLVARLRSDFDVRAETRAKKGSNGLGPVPAEAVGEALITDDDNELGTAFKWTVVEDSGDRDNSVTVSWKLRGSQNKCEKAKKVVQDTVELLKKHDRTAYLWLGDSSRYRRIIGAGGSTINDIRAKSGTTINVPRNGEEGVVTVRGDEAQVAKAKQLMFNVLKA